MLVKISKGKPHQSGFWVQKGKGSHFCATQGQSQTQQKNPPQGKIPNSRPPWGRVDIASPTEVSSLAVPPGTNHCHPELLCFSSGFCFRTTLLTSSLSTKPRSSPLYVGLACGLAAACVSQTAILCYS